MARTFLQCQACGCASESREGFQVLRATGTQAEEITLCPNCAARRQEAGGLELAYRFCDQCAVPVAPDRLELRSRTDTAMLGSVANHRIVTYSLCPACVKAYDRTGWGLASAVVVFIVVGLGLFVLIGWLLG